MITRFWVAQFTPDNILPVEEPHDFFRIFTSWKILLASMSRDKPKRHPSWDVPCRIFHINTGRMMVSEVTAIATQCAILEAPTMDGEEPACIPHFAVGEASDDTPSAEESNNAKAD